MLPWEASAPVLEPNTGEETSGVQPPDCDSARTCGWPGRRDIGDRRPGPEGKHRRLFPLCVPCAGHRSEAARANPSRGTRTQHCRSEPRGFCVADAGSEVRGVLGQMAHGPHNLLPPRAPQPVPVGTAHWPLEMGPPHHLPPDRFFGIPEGETTIKDGQVPELVG